MALSVLTPCASEPVTLATAKSWLRQDNSTDDDIISGLISAARDHVERFTRRSLVRTTWRMTLDTFPGGPLEQPRFFNGPYETMRRTWRYNFDTYVGSPIELPRGPVTAVTTGDGYAYAMPRVRYYDGNGTQQTLTVSTDYELDLSSNPARLQLPPMKYWPLTQPGKSNAVEVDFVVGYGTTAADCPALMRQAILMLVAHWYEHREAVGAFGTETPLAVDSILRIYQMGDYQ